MAGRVRVAKLNVDENPATASRFHVQSIPTLLVLKGGKEMERIVGVAAQIGDRATAAKSSRLKRAGENRQANRDRPGAQRRGDANWFSPLRME